MQNVYNYGNCCHNYNTKYLIYFTQLDEMERLKRLILVGKTPLKECPPELYNHPVFVFWRMVNREVAKASKKRADAYYRKLKASQKLDQVFIITGVQKNA